MSRKHGHSNVGKLCGHERGGPSGKPPLGASGQKAHREVAEETTVTGRARGFETSPWSGAVESPADPDVERRRLVHPSRGRAALQ